VRSHLRFILVDERRPRSNEVSAAASDMAIARPNTMISPLIGRHSLLDRHDGRQ
jgi:hypothetical protein